MLNGLHISTEEDKATLPWLDYSALTAINTCPRWGLIHSVYGKRFMSSDRAMPLEAGRAMHDMFAAVRMFELIEMYKNERVPDFIDLHGRKLFKSEMYQDRWDEALQIFDQKDDFETRRMRFGLHMLETSGFHDNPDDRRRTQTNLETAAITYMDRYPKSRYIPVVNAETGFVGVEVGFDIVLPTNPRIRFVGKVDGLCVDTMNENSIRVQENKTGSRIDKVWADSFVVGHQVTGYCVAMSVVLQKMISDAVIWGTQIPVPKSSAYGDGHARQPVDRNERQMREWLSWVQATLDMVKPYLPTSFAFARGDKEGTHPTDAPMFTHSCNRYFRSCSLIPLCVEEPDMRKHIFDNEMTLERWDPLAETE
jgi:hypothetical protein